MTTIKKRRRTQGPIPSHGSIGTHRVSGAGGDSDNANGDTGSRPGRAAALPVARHTRYFIGGSEEVTEASLRGDGRGPVVAVHEIYCGQTMRHVLTSTTVLYGDKLGHIARRAVRHGRECGYTAKGSIRFILERRPA